MHKLHNFEEFLLEKKSPYKKSTLLKYKKRFEDGEDLPVGIQNSLKAQGLIPRANGETKVSDEYKEHSIVDDLKVQDKGKEKKKKENKVRTSK